MNSSISPKLQRSVSDFFMKRKKGGVPKKETLGEYLWEYEAQYKEFKHKLNFQGFCKIKEDRSTKGKQLGVGIFFLSTFDGTPECPVRMWVEELSKFVQQHKVSEIEAIKATTLNFEGKAYDWWLFESSP